MALCPVCDCMLSLLCLASIVDNIWLHKKIGTVRRFNSDNSVSSSGRHPTFLSVFFFFFLKQTLKQTFGTLREKTLYESETDVTSSHRGCDFSVTVGDRTTRQNTDIMNQYGWAQCVLTPEPLRERERDGKIVSKQLIIRTEDLF